MKHFVIGDIHGAHKALVQCLARSKFDLSKDHLVALGDLCDGWPEVNKVIDELLQIKNLNLIRGNHDAWALEWMKEGWVDEIWTSQGGLATMESYQNDRMRVPESHKVFLQSAVPYLEMNNKLFVHGGISPRMELAKQDPEFLMWDRDLLNDAVRMSKKTPGHHYGKWDDIFVGHTTTEVYGALKPIHACNVWAVDTGGGWSGCLTLMDVDTKEYWQSDPVPDLYPNNPGRRATH